MATINNSELSKQMIDGAKIQISYDKIPNQLAEKVVPVMEVNPKLVKSSTILANFTRNATTSGLNIFTFQQDKDIFITGINVSGTQDATCDNILINVTGVIDGRSSQSIYNRNKQTTTALTYFDTINFTNPIKLDKNSSLGFVGTFTAGSMTNSITVFGFYLE